MICYLDTSVVLRWLLGAPGTHGDFFNWKAAGTSDILQIEANRTLQRLRMEGALNDENLAEVQTTFESLLDTLNIIECNAAIKSKAAGSFPTIIGTLDAIHLSSAMLWRARQPEADFQLLTHDRQLATAARAVGLAVDGA